MNLLILIDPPHDWQSHISCKANIIENEKNESHVCDFCSTIDTVSIYPTVTVTDIRDSTGERINYQERIDKSIEKVYANRYVCNDSECRRKFQNETWLRIDRKPGYTRQ